MAEHCDGVTPLQMHSSTALALLQRLRGTAPLDNPAIASRTSLTRRNPECRAVSNLTFASSRFTGSDGRGLGTTATAPQK